MTKGLVTIFALPHEIDDLHITLYNLKRNMTMLPHDIHMDLHLTFCVSDAVVDWERSVLSKDFFLAKFAALQSLWDWSASPRIRIEDGTDVLGCVSQRRTSLQYSEGYDFTIWLDCDMTFNDHMVLYLAHSYIAAVDNGYPNVIITPQLVRQWDSSWDELVHNQFKRHPLMYHESADIISDVLYPYGDIGMHSLPTFKFAGGWCTLLSNTLLRYIGIPQELGHYGLEDTFVTSACTLLNNHPIAPKQFMVTNLLVGENYINRTHNPYKPLLHTIDMKETFRAIAHQNFGPVLQRFQQRVLS